MKILATYLLGFVALLILLPIREVGAFSGIDPMWQYTQENQSSLCIHYRPVVVSLPDSVKKIITCNDEVSSILKEVGSDSNVVEIVFDGYIEDLRHIVGVYVTRERELIWEKIPFQTEIEYTKELPHRKKVIVKRGATGRRGVIKETVIYSDGKRKSAVVSKWIEYEPQTEYARVGTQYDLKTIEINGKKVSYWKTIKVLATSYDKTCYGCNDITATGAKLKKGVVAVDPKIIPMHTQMYIPGYGFGKAEDTGGKIKGNRIDLAYDDIRYGDWSRRWVTIYIID